MPRLHRTAIADRPFVAFVSMVIVTAVIYVGFQLAFEGRVDVVRTALFAVVFAAVTVTFSYFRR